MKKLLTIIIPSYNMESYLSRCLGSLIIDDIDLLKKLEVIVVNDGSRDHTSEIAHSFEEKYPDVFHTIDKTNGHYGSCINAALPLASGMFVKVLDADDWFDAQMFKKYLKYIVEFVSKKENVDLIVSNYQVVDQDGNLLRAGTYALPEGEVFGFDKINSLKSSMIMHAVAYRTVNIQNIGYSQTEGCLYTDNEWIFYLMKTVKNVVFFNGAVYKYMEGRQGQSISANVFGKNLYQLIDLLERLLGDYVVTRDICGLAYRKFMENYLKRIYSICVGVFSECPFLKENQKIYALDGKYKKCCPKDRESVGYSFCIMKRSPFRFYYIRAWQNYKYCRALPLVIANLYKRLRVLVRHKSGYTIMPLQNGILYKG